METKVQLSFVDALRGIAVLGVLLVHTVDMVHPGHALERLCFTGQRGVQLFYIVSAFTLCLSLDGDRREHFPISNYLLRRLFRVAPLFYVAICGNLLLYTLAPSYSSLNTLSFTDIFLGLIFLNGLRPHAINNVAMGGWSVAVETTFYLVLPWLRRRIRTIRGCLLVLLTTAPVLWLLSTGLMLQAPDPVTRQYFAFLWFPVELPVFLMGILSYLLWRRYIAVRPGAPALEAAARNDRKDMSLLLLVAAFVLFWAAFPLTDQALYATSFVFVPVLLSLALHPWRLLVNPVTRFLGKISYGIYLLHFFVCGLLIHLGNHRTPWMAQHFYGKPLGVAGIFTAMTLLTIPLAMLSWKVIEQPGIRIGRRVIALRENEPAKRTSRSLIPSWRLLERGRSSRDAQF